MGIDISDLNLFIVGAPRCGTTALYRYLQTHPDIFLPQRKEPHYFGADLRGRYPHLLRDRHEYLRLFAGWRGERWFGEGSPGISTPNAPLTILGAVARRQKSSSCFAIRSR